MTRLEVLALIQGMWVQEDLSVRAQLGITGKGRRSAVSKWGRPRLIVKVDKHWKTSKGKWCVCFQVRFRDQVLHWAAAENGIKHRLVKTVPTAEELAAWAEGAEASPLRCD